MIWTPEKTECLGLLIDGGATASEAARELSIPRNSAVGRAWRLGWRFGVPRQPGQRGPIQPRLRRASTAGRKLPPEETMVKLYCGFDQETCGAIRAMAKADGVTQAQTIRELVEWGLMSVEEGRRP